MHTTSNLMKLTKNSRINEILIAGALALVLSVACAHKAQSPANSSPAENLESPTEPESSQGKPEPAPEESGAQPEKTAPKDEAPSEASQPPSRPAAEVSPPEAALEASSDAGSSAVEESPSSEETPTDAYVALAQFTTEIEDREPVDAISFLDNQSREIIFFTDFRGFGGQTLTHRWEYRGKVMGEVTFDVESDRWRAWSRKQLLPVWLGDWTVSVVKPDGEVIAAETFSYSREP